MTRSRATRTAEQIGTARIEQAARAPRRRERDDFGWLPPEPIRPVSDPEVAAEREARKTEEDHAARVEVASHIVLSGCEGRLYCPGREHAVHLAYGREVLDALGLLPKAVKVAGEVR